MNENLEVVYEGDYIRARQSGPTNFDVSLELWTRIAAACDEHNCYNILENRLSPVP